MTIPMHASYIIIQEAFESILNCQSQSTADKILKNFFLFFFFFFFFFLKKISLDISSYADNSHQMSRLTFSEKKKNRMPSATNLAWRFNG